MPTLRQRANDATDDDYRKRIKQGLIQVAGEVYEEDPATDNHAARRALAKLVLTNPTTLVDPLAQRIAANPFFGTDPSPTGNDAKNDTDAGDAAMLYLIRAFWNDYTESV